jgi:hypothetical protein
VILREMVNEDKEKVEEMEAEVIVKRRLTTDDRIVEKVWQWNETQSIPIIGMQNTLGSSRHIDW